MKLGAANWPFKWDPPYGETIPRIARLGFKAIELIAWDRQTLDEYDTPQRVRGLRDTVASEGLHIFEFALEAVDLGAMRDRPRQHGVPILEVQEIDGRPRCVAHDSFGNGNELTQILGRCIPVRK